jgi:uncharacterized protein (TIGR02246 family)
MEVVAMRHHQRLEVTVVPTEGSTMSTLLRAVSSLFVILVPWAFLSGCGGAQPKPAPAPDRQLLERQRAALGEAFNRNDAEAWAAVYAADAEFILETGQVADGRASIQKLFAKVFADNKGIRVTAGSTKERFITPEIVVEDGTYRLTGKKDGGPSEGRYTAVWIHRNGQWLLLSHRSWVPVKQAEP